MVELGDDRGGKHLLRAAKQKIDRLTEQGETYKDETIKLSKAMYVMSPYTSLIGLGSA